MKFWKVGDVADVERIEAVVAKAANAALVDLRRIVAADDAIAVLAEMKFKWAGRDPLSPDRPLNIVEQLNQTFTCLASCAAARWLLEHHAAHAPLRLMLGAHPGRDIVSEDGVIQAEVFAATHPGSNNTLKEDAARIPPEVGVRRFVFYLSPLSSPLAEIDGVQVVRLPYPAWTDQTRAAGA